jgi:hypothetical protein
MSPFGRGQGGQGDLPGRAGAEIVSKGPDGDAREVGISAGLTRSSPPWEEASRTNSFDPSVVAHTAGHAAVRQPFFISRSYGENPEWPSRDWKSIDGAIEQSQEFSDRSMRLDGMPQGLIGSNSIVVLTADLFAFDDSARFEIGDDPLDGALRDSHLERDFAKHDGRVACQQHEHVRMIRQEGPLQTGRRSRRHGRGDSGGGAAPRSRRICGRGGSRRLSRRKSGFVTGGSHGGDSTGGGGGKTPARTASKSNRRNTIRK